MSTLKSGEHNNSEVVVYIDEQGNPKLDVKFEGENAWLTQSQLVELFDSSKANISEHISNIFEEGELSRDSTVRNFRTVRKEGSREVKRDIEHYNLDLIISLGYRVKSGIATHFRIWATSRLHEYIVKGFTMNDELLKSSGGGSYWKELLDRIRDIRSSEKVLYRQVLDLYATSVDYESSSSETKEFFAIVQNKLHYGAHKHTAAEIISSRADAGKDFMGLLTFSGDTPNAKEVLIAKNYLDESELKKLSTLVSAFFDAAEFRAQNQQLTYMRDWLENLDVLINAVGGNKLENAGSVSAEQAKLKAKDEYAKYSSSKKLEPSKVERDYLQMLKDAEKKLEGKTDE